MNARERVLKTLDHEEPDKVPYLELMIQNPYTAEKLRFSAAGSASQTLKFKPEKILAFFGKIKGLPNIVNSLIPKITKRPKMLSPIIKGLIPQLFKFYMHLGVDLTTFGVAPMKYFKWIPPNRIVNEFGQIYEIRNTSGALSAVYIGGYFKSEEIYDDFPKMDHDQALGELLFKRLLKTKELKNGQILVAPGISNGLFDTTYMGMGIENFSKALVKDPAFVQKIVKDKEKAYIAVIKTILDETDSPVFFIGDDLAYNSGPFISPRYFKKFFLPGYKRIAKVVHRSGAKLLFHTDGNIELFLKLEGFLDCFDLIHPWQVSAKMDIVEAKQKYGNRISLAGNVPIELLVHKTPKDVASYVKYLLKNCAPGGGYFLSSGNSIVPEIPANNYLAMLITRRRYGNYPIEI